MDPGCIGRTNIRLRGIYMNPKPPPTVTPIRRSKRLSEKRGRQGYQSGQIISLASKRKALHINLDKGNSPFSFDILNLLSNQTLLEFAQIYKIDLGDTENSRTLNIDFIRNLPSTVRETVKGTVHNKRS